MKKMIAVLMGLMGLCALVVFAQREPELWVYSRGIFSPSENPVFNVYSSPPLKSAQVTVNRVEDPLAVLRGKPEGYGALKLPESIKLTPIKRETIDLERNQYQVKIGKLEPGLYLIGFASGSAKGLAIALVTDLGIIVKRTGKDANVLSVNRVNGQKRTATLYATQGTKQSSVKTNSSGLAKVVMFSETGGVIVANSGSSWAVSKAWWQTYAVEKFKVLGQTDRPLYKPGDLVSWRGNLREAKTLQPITAKNINAVACLGTTVLWKGRLEVNRFGSFSSSFSLSRRAKIGEYAIFANPAKEADCEYDDDLQIAGFGVEDYVKPDFSVSLDAPKNALQGTTIKFKTGAEYLFGGGVSGGKALVRVVRNQRYERDDPYFEDFGYYWSDWYGNFEREVIVLERTATLDAKGQLEVSVPLAVDKESAAERYDISVIIEDEMRRPQTQTASLVAFPSQVRVALRSKRYVTQVGESLEIEVGTRDLEGEQADASVELELVRRTYDYFNDRYQVKDEVIEKRTVSTMKGQVVATFNPKKGGGYTIRARAKDAQGRVSKGETFVWVTEENPSWYWWGDSGMQIKLDKRDYKVGDTAVAFVSGVKRGVDVWLTLEADTVQQSRVVRAISGTVSWSFKVTKAMQPNVTLKAAYLQAGQANQAETRVSVPKLDQRLMLEILPSKTKYQAGEKGTVRVLAKDINGKPVPQTELALSIVDQGIYLLREEGVPDPFEVLHGNRVSVIGTATSEDEPLFIYDERGRLTAQAVAPSSPTTGKAEASGKMAADQVAEPPSVKVRKDFRDTADWQASVVTDDNGEAVLEVPFPENLTTWRITARGANVPAQAGEARQNVIVTQDIIARVGMPTFLVRGDSMQLRGIVNNNLDTATTGGFKFALDGLSAAAPLESSLTVLPGQRSSFDTRVSAPNFGTARVTASFTNGAGGDALELPLRVKPRGFQEAIAWAADSKRGARRFAVPSDANLESAELRVVLTPSLLSAVRPALERLIGYPYGCTEQTLSRFVPALLAKGIVPRADLDELIEKGLDRLAVLRHADGGWGFWTQDQSTVEMTGQVVLALTRAKALGVKLDPEWLPGAVNWLRQNVENADAWRSERIVALRAMAEADSPMVAVMERFAADRNLEPYQLAHLALAFQKIGQRDEAIKLLARMKAKRIESGSIVRWERPNREYDWYYWWDDNPTLVTAVALEALAKLEPSSNLIPKAVNYLLQARRGDWWISTQDTAAIVVAALSLPKPSDSSQTVRVLMNGQTLIEQIINEDGANLELDEAIMGKLRVGENTLVVKGDLNYAANLQFIREPTRLDAANNGIDVQRTYFKLEKRWNENAKNWDFIPQPLIKDGVAEPLEQGDLIVAKINISAKGNMRHMQIIEPVPAGFSAVNETGFDLETGKPVRFRDPWRWWYWYSGREIYQDRVEMFAGYFNKQQSLYVMLRATTPGTYTALPTNAELMYDPDVRGRSSAATLTIKE